MLMLVSSLLNSGSAPRMNFRFVSYTVPEPSQTAAGVLTYVGGERLDRINMLAAFNLSAEVSGIRFRYSNRRAVVEHRSYFDMYFWTDPSLPNASYAAWSAREIENHLKTAPNRWSFWSDRHFAYLVDDIDPSAIRLARDGIPIYAIPGGIYFSVPGGLTIQVQSLSKLSSFLWYQAFHFCEYTDEASHPYRLTNFTEVPSVVPALPVSLYPGHHAFPTADASASRVWAANFLYWLDVAIDYSSTGAGGYAYANHTTCADVHWVTLNDNDFKLHFVTQKLKRQGKVHVSEYEAVLLQMRSQGKQLTQDGFFGSRIGFSVDNLQPYWSKLHAKNEKYLWQDGRLLVHSPWGFLVELFPPDASDVAFDTRAFGPIELCFSTGCRLETQTLLTLERVPQVVPGILVILVLVAGMVLLTHFTISASSHTHRVIL